MRIVCPNCAARYDVPDSVLGAEPRPVRCARCETEWVPEAPAPAAAPPAFDIDAPTLARVLAEQPSDPDEPPPPPRERVPLAPPPPARIGVERPLVERPGRPGAPLIARLAWAASVGLLLLTLGAAYVWRAQVQAAWPPSQRAYAALGLH